MTERTARIIEFPLTPTMAERLFYLELERTANQMRPRLDRRITRAYRRTHPLRFPPYDDDAAQ